MAEKPHGGKVDRYRIVTPIGSGGFATVYRSVDERLGSEVALKVLAENHSLVPDYRERFISEAQHLRRVDSYWVASIFDLGETEQLPAFLEEEVTYRGRRYGSPLSIQADLLIYNKRIFDRFDVPYPTSGMTWQEFIEMSKRVTYLPDDPAEAIYAVVYMRWEYLFYSMKGEFFSEDGTRIEIEAEPMRRAVQIYRDMIQKHEITLPMGAVSTFAAQGGSGGGEFGGSYRQLFADGRFAMVFRPKSMLVHLRYALENQKKAREEWLADPSRREDQRPEVLELGTAVPPRFGDREPAYWARARSVLVNRFGPNPERALRFLAYLRTPEYSRAVNENYDYMPPEPAFVDLGVGQGYSELDEVGAHENSKRALEFGHITRKSPFLQDLEVKRAVDQQIERLIADPGLTVEAVLADARRELEGVMRQRLGRDPDLMQLYQSRLASQRVAR